MENNKKRKKQISVRINEPLAEAWDRLMSLGYATDSDLLREMIRTFYREKFGEEIRGGKLDSR